MLKESPNGYFDSFASKLKMEPLDPPPSPSIGSSNVFQSAAPPLDNLIQATISRFSRAAVKEGNDTPLGPTFRDGEEEEGREKRQKSHSDSSPEKQNTLNISRDHASASEGKCTSSSALCNRVDRRSMSEREKERERTLLELLHDGKLPNQR